MFARFLSLALIALALIHCSRDTSSGRSVPRPTATSSSGLDLGRLMRVAHFAYRASEHGFAAHDVDYAVEVSSDAVSFTPRAGRKSGAAVSLQRRGVFAGVTRLDTGAPVPTVDSEGALSIARGEVIERFVNDERGVEQSWSFAARPPSGELTVHLGLAAPSSITTTATGVHLFDPTTGLGVRIGHATFIDHSGARTIVPAVVEGDELRFAVPSDVVAHAQFPAVLDPLISTELGLDGPPVSLAATDHQTHVAMECGATNCLIAWTDYRTGDAQGYGARLDKSGAVLDPHGIVLADIAITLFASPAVAWDGTQYFVTYQTDPSDTATGVLVRVDSAGRPSTPTALPFQPGYQEAIACGSSRCLVAGRDAAGAVRFSRFDSSGAALDVPAKTLATSSTDSRVAVAHLAGTFMLAWTDASLRLRTARVDAAGTILDTTPKTPLSAAAPHWNASLTASSTGYLVAWQDADNRGYAVSASRLDATGAALDPSGIDVARTTVGGGFFLYPMHTASDGTNFIVTYTELVNATFVTTNALAKRISGAGKLLDMSAIRLTTTNDGAYAAIAFDGATYHAAVTRPITSSDVYTERVSTMGAVSSQTLVSRSTNAQQRPILSAGGGQYLLAWVDRRSSVGYYAGDVYAARVSASGALLDPTGIGVATDSAAAESDPAISFDGTDWFVVWSHQLSTGGRAHVWGRRVDAAGKLVETASRQLGFALNGETTPAVAFDGTNHLLVWKDYGSPTAIQGRRFSKTLAPIDVSIIPILTSTSYQEPEVAFDGTNYLVVAVDLATGRDDIVAGRVTPAGAPLGSGFVVASAGLMQTKPRIAVSPTHALVVWQDGRNTVDNDVFGARVKDGVVLEPGGIPIATGSGDQTAPAVAWDGSNFFVAWGDKGLGNSDVRGLFVSDTGVVRGPVLGIATTTDTEHSAAVATTSATQRLVAYIRADTSPTYGSDRVRGRLVSGLGNGSACTASSQCTSEQCVDGICCDSACTGQCEACDLTGKLGWCSAVTGAPRGLRAACGGTGAGGACGARCDGADRAKCNYPAADSTPCSNSACAMGIETHASTCDGAGLCKDTPILCGAYACGPLTCLTRCTSTTDCAVGFSCKDTACVPAASLGEACTSSAACGSGLFCTDGVCCGTAACGAGESCALGKGTCKKLDGVTCTVPGECGSGFCVDGLCCESACGGQCAACDLEGAKGRCRPVTGTPRGARSACPTGEGSCGAKQCDGTDATQCAAYVHGVSKLCSDPRCDVDKFVAAATCNGAGACTTPAETSCVPFGCTELGCRTSCSADDQCAKGFACRDAVCKALGTKCSDDGTSIIAADGASSACAPYVCRAGACVAHCESVTDCSADHVCSSTGQCVPRPPPAGVEESSGCAVGARSQKNFALLIMAAVVLRLLRRRGEKRVCP